MRFWTIWTMPAMSFAERLRRTKEWLELKIARMLPKGIRYWVLVVEDGRTHTNQGTHPGEATTFEKMENIRPTGRTLNAGTQEDS
jgi:hypothetical protein